MKYLAPLVAILGFTAPTTIAGPLDGNGVWCPYLSSESFTNSAFGYWFHANKATSYLIEGYGIQAGEPFYYTEVHDSHIELDVDEWLLDRQTLQFGNIQCHLVGSLEELLQRPQAVIDKLRTTTKA